MTGKTLEERAKIAVEKWKSENLTDEAIEMRITQLLDDKRDDILLKILGFDNHWGRWEVDHCNGRDGNSFIGSSIKEMCQKAADKWVEDNFKTLPTIPKSLVKELRKEYLERVKRISRDKVYSIIEREESDEIEKLVFEVVDNVSDNIEMR